MRIEIQWMRAGSSLGVAAIGVAAIAGGASVAGCGGGSPAGTDAGPPVDAPAVAVIEIEGTYAEGTFSTHTIEGSRWTMSGMDFMAGFTITRVDNAEDWAVARNDATNAFSPDLFSRFEWVSVGSELYYCQAAFDAADEAAAVAATRPDRASPATGGCAGFPWSLLTPAAP
jgi:hypothetical protein